MNLFRGQAFLLIFICIFFTVLPLMANKQELKHEVTVTLKLIQVYVLDEKGNPVRNLEEKDFKLYDNGEIKKITEFEKHFISLDNQSQKTDEQRNLEKSSFRMNRKIFLFLDIQRNDAIGLMKAKRLAYHFIDQHIGPEDEVGVLSYTPLQGLILNEYLTKDRERVKEAVRNAKELPVKPLSEIHRDEKILSIDGRTGHRIEDKIPGADELFGESNITSLMGGMGTEIKTPYEFLVSFRELSFALQYIPGIKHIILFSGGSSEKMQQTFQLLGQKLASANCLVHSIDTVGKRDHFFVESKRMSGESLKALSENSGGLFFPDSNDFVDIADRINTSTMNYYVLGYYVDQSWDGNYHKIQVVLKNPKLKIHAQSGYYNPKPFHQLSEMEKMLHLIDLSFSENPYFGDPQRFDLLAMPIFERKKTNVMIISELKPELIQNMFTDSVEIYSLYFDQNNNLVDSNRGEIKPIQIPQDLVFMYSFSPLDEGEYDCRMILRNMKTGKSAVGGSKILIKSQKDNIFPAYPPLILVPEKKGVFMKIIDEREDKKEPDFKNLFEIYPNIPKNSSPLVGALNQTVRKLNVAIRYSKLRDEFCLPKIKTILSLTNSSDVINLPFSIVDSWEFKGDCLILLELSLLGLNPCGYDLSFCLTDSNEEILFPYIKHVIIK